MRATRIYTIRFLRRLYRVPSVTVRIMNKFRLDYPSPATLTYFIRQSRSTNYRRIITVCFFLNTTFKTCLDEYSVQKCDDGFDPK